MVEDKKVVDIPAFYEIYKDPLDQTDKCNSNNIIIKEIKNEQTEKMNNMNINDNTNNLKNDEFLETVELNKKCFELIKCEEIIREKLANIETLKNELDYLKNSCMCGKLERDYENEQDSLIYKMKVDKLQSMYYKLLEEIDKI